MGGLLLFCRNAFDGLSREAWLLSLMLFINRSGAIILPFLGVYASEALHFSLIETGLILSCYGLGSVLSSILGGWLTDKFGHFKVQFLCQLLGGGMYFLFMNVNQFEHLAIGVFLLAVVNDCIRPANSAAVATYATPETLTRAFSLNRMAVNLGFVVGPVIGGILAAISYKWLFVANGVTGILAAIFFFAFFVNRQGEKMQQANDEQPEAAPALSPYKDYPFLLFVFLCCCFAIIFYQLFSTLPLYYRQQYLLSEENIGLLMSFNGLIILLTEMFIVYFVARYIKKWTAVTAGILLLGVSFMLFNMVQHISVLLVSMLLFSISEILAMPFMSSIAAKRSESRNRGAYMGLFTVIYALPLVLSPFLGTSIVSQFGFTTLWWASGVLAVFTAAAIYFVIRYMEHPSYAADLSLTALPIETIITEGPVEKPC